MNPVIKKNTERNKRIREQRQSCVHNDLYADDYEDSDEDSDEAPMPWDDLEEERPVPVMTRATTAIAIRDLYERHSKTANAVRAVHSLTTSTLKYTVIALAASAVTLLVYAAHIAK